MTPQSLKSAILQLAIQGKLVEQRPEEGSAEDLFRQIQAEKLRLVKAGKIKKGKPLPEIAEDEIPFEIPESWKWVRIGKIFNLQAGKNITRENIFTEASPKHQYRCYGGNGCRGYVSDYNREGHYALIGRQGALCGNINYAEGKFYATEHAVVVEQFAETSVLWAGYFLQALNLNQYATATAQPGLAVANINQVPIPLPPLPEQHRIVAKIEELLPLVDRYEQAWTKLEDFTRRFPADMQKALLQMAIQGHLVDQRPEEGTGEQLYKKILAAKNSLRPKSVVRSPSSPPKPLPPIAENEIPFEIPNSWKWVRVADIWSVLNGDRGKNYPAKSTLSKTGIPFISALNLNGKTVVEDDRLLCLSEKQYDLLGNGKLIKGDIVVCIRGSLGKHGRYPFEKGAIASSLVIMRSKLQLPILDDFLMLYLDTPLFFSEIKKYDNGTAQPNLAAKSLEQFLFPLPPLAEQKRIVAKLEELLPLCEKLK